MEGQFCYHIGIWSGMACTTWDTEVGWQRRFNLDMREYPNVQDRTNHTIVILVKAAYCTDTDGFHTLAH